MVYECKRAILLGLALDGTDGAVRVTRGENFHLVGGSHGTHQSMQEKCIKFNEKLQAHGKQLGDLEKKELLEIAADCEMNVVVPEEPS